MDDAVVPTLVFFVVGVSFLVRSLRVPVRFQMLLRNRCVSLAWELGQALGRMGPNRVEALKF